MRTATLPLLAGFTATPAMAGIEICNEATIRQTVAIGYEDANEQWTSEGWWRIEPGTCATVRAKALDRPVFYYRATAAGGSFDGPYAFCTHHEPFTIVGDTECKARGFERTRFREVALANVQNFTLTLVSPEGSNTPPPAEPSQLRITGGYTRGTLGEPFTNSGIFTGRKANDGLEYCEIIADGWRWHAFRGGGTPDGVIDALFDAPLNMPVFIESDILSYGDITVEIVLSEVEENPGGDPFAAMRAHLQGDWVSMDDGRSTFTVSSADVYDYYDGEFMAHHMMTLEPSCDGMEGLGAGWVRTTLETQDGWCMIIRKIGASMIELANAKGAIPTYIRTR